MSAISTNEQHPSVLGKRPLTSSEQESRYRVIECNITTDNAKSYLEFLGVRSEEGCIKVSSQSLERRIADIGLPSENFDTLPETLQKILIEIAFVTRGLFQQNYQLSNSKENVQDPKKTQLLKEIGNWKIDYSISFERRAQISTLMLNQFMICYETITTEDREEFLNHFPRTGLLTSRFLSFLKNKNKDINEEDLFFLKNCFKLLQVEYKQDFLFDQKPIDNFIIKKLVNSDSFRNDTLYLKKTYKPCFLFNLAIFKGPDEFSFLDGVLQNRIANDTSTEVSDTAKKMMALMTNVTKTIGIKKSELFLDYFEKSAEKLHEDDFLYKFDNENTILHQLVGYKSWRKLFLLIADYVPRLAYVQLNHIGDTPLISCVKTIKLRQNDDDDKEVINCLKIIVSNMTKDERETTNKNKKSAQDFLRKPWQEEFLEVITTSCIGPKRAMA